MAAVLVFLLISYCAQITARHGEPSCPQFDRFTFEEKVLEKMVRVEHKLELIEEKLKIWEKNLNTKMTELDEAEVEMERAAEEKLALLEFDINTKLQEVANAENDRKVNAEALQEKHKRQSQEQKEKLETAINDLKKRTDQLTKTVTDKQASVDKTLQENLKAHEDSLKAVTEQYQTPAVVFQATTSNEHKITTGTLIFDVVNLNKGDAYDSSTGIFTVPREGYYIFIVQLCAHSSEPVMDAKLKTNDGHIVAAIYNKDSDNNGLCASSSGVVHLNKGQTVSVVGENTGSTTISLHTSSTSINFFSGVLIHSS